jgi:hypothetical protein
MSNLPPGCRVCDLPGYNDDVHPLSDELYGWLEDNGIPEELIDQMCISFERSLNAGPYTEITSDDLIYYSMHHVKSCTTGFNCVWITYQKYAQPDVVFEGSYTEAMVKLINYDRRNFLIASDYMIIAFFTAAICERYKEIREKIDLGKVIDGIEDIMLKHKRIYYFGKHPEWPNDKETP